MGGGRIVAAAVALVALCPSTARALPASGPRETVDVAFTTTRPGSPTGLTYRSELRGDDGGEPVALRRLVVGTPAGSVVDTTAPERCPASDEELRLRGDGACPPASLVGSGWAEILVAGLGRQRFDLAAFNDDGAQFQTVKQDGQVNAIVRGVFTDEGLDARIPTCITGGQPPEGCPSDQARLVASELVVPPYVAGGRALFTTPPECPASGRWSTPVVLGYADGVTDRVMTEQPCERPPAANPAACRSRRTVVLAALARVGLRSIVATVDGRRSRLDPRRPVIDLRGLPQARYTVRITALTKSGRRLRFVRRYRTCAAA